MYSLTGLAQTVTDQKRFLFDSLPAPTLCSYWSDTDVGSNLCHKYGADDRDVCVGERDSSFSLCSSVRTYVFLFTVLNTDLYDLLHVHSTSAFHLGFFGGRQQSLL